MHAYIRIIVNSVFIQFYSGLLLFSFVVLKTKLLDSSGLFAKTIFSYWAFGLSPNLNSDSTCFVVCADSRNWSDTQITQVTAYEYAKNHKVLHLKM